VDKNYVFSEQIKICFTFLRQMLEQGLASGHGCYFQILTYCLFMVSLHLSCCFVMSVVETSSVKAIFCAVKEVFHAWSLLL
jgi:hypothetical protein